MRQHLHQPLRGNVCLLGRQCVYATYTTVVNMMQDEGWKPPELDDNTPRLTNIPAWKALVPYQTYTSDEACFRLLGADRVQALDITSSEGADIVCDLNFPLPDNLVETFDIVIDGGLLEHVFDIRQALININRLLKPSGRVFHFSPTSNYIDHGYYQLSPIFFLDYYAANKFADCQIWLCEHTRPFAAMQQWKVYKYRPGVAVAPFGWLWSQKAWSTFAVAQKSNVSTWEAIPIQGRTAWAARQDNALVQGTSGTNRRRRWRRRLEPLLRRSPMVWKLSVCAIVWGLLLIGRRPTRHPFVGKL